MIKIINLEKVRFPRSPRSAHSSAHAFIMHTLFDVWIVWDRSVCKSYPRESKGELLHCVVYSLTASLIMIICRSDDSCSILATFISFSTYKLYETIHSQRFVSTQRGYKIHTSWLQWQQQLLQTFFSDDLLTPPARNHQACRLLRQESWEGTRDAEALGGLWVPDSRDSGN